MMIVANIPGSFSVLHSIWISRIMTLNIGMLTLDVVRNWVIPLAAVPDLKLKRLTESPVCTKAVCRDCISVERGRDPHQALAKSTL